MRQQDKSETIDLLEHLAHRIRNPLHSMGINLEVAKGKIRDLPGKTAATVQKHLEIVSSELSTTNEIIRGFTEYISPLESRRTRIRVETLLRGAYQLLREKMADNGIRVDWELSENLPAIYVNNEQIKKALFEILLNAAEASNQAIIRATAKNNYVEIQIRDRGQGISSGLRPKVFDPFYTTKKGRLGMGLPIAKKMIEANDGEIRLASGLRRGTTILVSFSRKAKK
ncbi:MAG: ATP-binding protein [bacterium]